MKIVQKSQFCAQRAFLKSSEQIRSSRLNFQDRTKVDTDSESLKDSDMCSHSNFFSKNVSLCVKIVIEVEIEEIESKLGAHSEQISKN